MAQSAAGGLHAARRLLSSRPTEVGETRGDALNEHRCRRDS